MMEIILTKKNGEYELNLKGDQTKIVKKPLPTEAKLRIKSDHHEVSLAFREGKNPSGSIKSKFTKEGKFGLELKDGRLSGTIEHQGEHHSTKIQLSPSGWKGEIIAKTDVGNISFEVEGNKKVILDNASLNVALNL